MTDKFCFLDKDRRCADDCEAYYITETSKERFLYGCSIVDNLYQIVESLGDLAE